MPNAVKMYMWKACHNLLPTKGNLFRRGVWDKNLCLVYLQEEETVVHVTWACSATNDAWGETRIKLQKSPCDMREFLQVFMEVVLRCDIEEVELFAVLARCLWLRRNDFVHGGNLTHPSQVVQDAEATLEDFCQVNSIGEQQGREITIRHKEISVAAPENMIKIIWDAAVDKNKKTIGMGMITRDGRGLFVAAASKVVHLVADPVVAETLAAFHALLFCLEQGFQNVIFEGDTQQVVNEVNFENPCNAKYRHLIEDIRLGLRSMVGSRFYHVRRTTNSAMHALAIEARTRVTDQLWCGVPSCVSDIVRK